MAIAPSRQEPDVVADSRSEDGKYERPYAMHGTLNGLGASEDEQREHGNGNAELLQQYGPEYDPQPVLDVDAVQIHPSRPTFVLSCR